MSSIVGDLTPEIFFEKNPVHSMSDKTVISLLEEIGMPVHIAKNVLKVFKKSVHPQPKGYYSTDTIARQLALNSFSSRSNFDQKNHDLNGNLTESAKMIILAEMLNLDNHPVPWYWVTKDLAKDLSQTDTTETLPRNILLPPIGVLMIPKGILQTTTGDIGFIAYRILNPGEDSIVEFKTSETGDTTKLHTSFVGEAGFRVLWVAMQDIYVYGGISGLAREGNEFRVLSEEKSFIEDAEIEEAETNSIRSLLLNTFVYASQQPQAPRQSKKAFGKSSNKKTLNRPLFIGEGYKSAYYSLANKDSTGEKSTKAIHWRRGHWKRVAHGEKRSLRKWVLIPPVLVGLSQSSEAKKRLS